MYQFVGRGSLHITVHSALSIPANLLPPASVVEFIEKVLLLTGDDLNDMSDEFDGQGSRSPGQKTRFPTLSDLHARI